MWGGGVAPSDVQMKVFRYVLVECFLGDLASEVQSLLGAIVGTRIIL